MLCSRNLSKEEQAAFDKEYAILRKQLVTKTFNSSKDAAMWLHDNVHPLASKYDIEIGAGIRNQYSLEKGDWVTDADITTQYNRNAVNINIGGDVKAIWHSHGALSSGFSNMDLSHIDGTADSTQYREIYVSGGHIGAGAARNSLLYQSQTMNRHKILCSHTCH